MHTETYNKLTVYVLTDEQAEKQAFNYKYLVHNNWTSHTAFKTLVGFNHWMDERHLKLNGELKDGESCSILGEYVKASLLNIDPILPDYSNSHTVKNWDSELFTQFGQSNKLTKGFTMSNGDWTDSYIYHGINADVYPNKNPITIIYYLNPNCKRTVYDWKQFYDGIPLTSNPDILEKKY